MDVEGSASRWTAWADDRARREPRARWVLPLAAAVGVAAWVWLFFPAEHGYWAQTLVGSDEYPSQWRDSSTLTHVPVRLLAGLAPALVVLVLAVRRVAGARAATAGWVATTLLAMAAFAPALTDVAYKPLAEETYQRTCAGGPWSTWKQWWLDRGAAIGWERLRALPDLGPFGGDGLPRLLGLFALLLLVVAAVLSRAMRRSLPRGEVFVRRAAGSTLAGSALLLLVAGWQLATRPQPADYGRSLPVLGTLPTPAEVMASPSARPAVGMEETARGLVPASRPEDVRHPPESGAVELDRRVGPVVVRLSCWRYRADREVYCDAYLRGARWVAWRRAVQGQAWSGDARSSTSHVELRYASREGVVFLTRGGQVGEVFVPDAPPAPSDGLDFYRPERWFPLPPARFAGVAHFAVAPHRSTVALALGGLLAVLLLRAFDRRGPRRTEGPRGYRADAGGAWELAGPEPARVEAWVREESLERAWRTVAIVGLTNVPLVALFVARLIA